MIRFYEPQPYFGDQTKAPAISLPCEPWETPQTREKTEKRDPVKAFSQHREYVQQRLEGRRALVRRLVEQGCTRTEIRQAMPGLTSYVLENDLAVMNLNPKSERGTKCRA